MLSRLLLTLLLTTHVAAPQTLTVPSAKDPTGDAPVGMLCPKAWSALGSKRPVQIVAEMIIDSSGSVGSFKINSPKGLHLDKDPEVKHAFKRMHFNPATKDGEPVRAIINMTFDCSPESTTPSTQPVPPSP
jgi:hypothetical protein